MPHARFHSIPSPKRLSNLGRALAALQLAKETLTIIVVGLPLLWAQPVLFPAALPGVVLYAFRWTMVLGRVRRRVATAVWGLTLLDEVWGLWLYQQAVDAPTARQLRYVKWSCGLGAAFTLAALLEIGYRRYYEHRRLRKLVRAV